jgi:hypothetical protein
MARGDKRATQREDVTLAEQRPVKLQASKRFFTAGGSDQAVRQARALSDAFGTGLKFIGEELDRRNIKGQERALGTAAAGGERDVEDKNQGYNRAWDEMDAEADVNFMKADLPEVLRGADWENLEEGAVAGIISDYMKEQYEGIDPASWYGQKLAPAMLAIEAETLATHRDMVVERIQEEQRTTIFSNLKSRFETSKLNPETPDGAFDYNYLAEQTNIFFDGAAKMDAYWETMYQFAIENGQPELIKNTPERFPSGDPTGINDPIRQDDHRAALNAATTQAGKIAAAELEQIEAAQSAYVESLKWTIHDKEMRGESSATEVEELRGLAQRGIAEFNDYSSAKSFVDGQISEFEERSPNYRYSSALWADIFGGQAGFSDIYEARDQGLLGFGKTADDLMARMMGTVQRISPKKDVMTRPEVTQFRSVINKNYDPARNGPAEPFDQSLHQINVMANLEYTQRMLDGEAPEAAFEAVINKYDSLKENMGTQVDIEGKTGSEFAREFVFTEQAMQDIVKGKVTYREATYGVPQRVIIDALIDAHAEGMVTDADLEKMGIEL